MKMKNMGTTDTWVILTRPDGTFKSITLVKTHEEIEIFEGNFENIIVANSNQVDFIKDQVDRANNAALGEK